MQITFDLLRNLNNFGSSSHSNLLIHYSVPCEVRLAQMNNTNLEYKSKSNEECLFE